MDNDENSDENLGQTIGFIEDRNPWHRVSVSCFDFLKLMVGEDIVTMISDIYPDGEYDCNSVAIFGCKSVGVVLL